MTTPSGTPSLRPRFARERIEETLQDTPITVLQGARQVGKSTLVRQVADGRDAVLMDLDSDATYAAAIADPEAFVRRTTGLLVIDEVQRAPELLRAMKVALEEDRRPGRFLITGSANLLELPGTQESLAGRAETVVLYGLSQGEVTGHRRDFISQALSGDLGTLSRTRGELTREEYLERICAGSYPEPLTRTGRRRAAWFGNYLGRIVSRDAQDVSRLANIDRLPALVRLIAASNAGELNTSRLARDVGLPASTTPPYIDLLETLYLVHRLPAWGHNLTKRVAARPKIALLDTGLAAWLNNVTPRGDGARARQRGRRRAVRGVS